MRQQEDQRLQCDSGYVCVQPWLLLFAQYVALRADENLLPPFSHRWQEWVHPGPGDYPSGDRAIVRVLPADSPGYHFCPVVCARFEPTTTFSYTSSFLLTRDSQEKDEIAIQEYTMPKDSTTDDNQQGKRDASNMYVVMGFYIASI